MTTVATAATQRATTASSTAATSRAATTPSTAASATKAVSTKVGPAAVVNLSEAAKGYIKKLGGGTSTSDTSGVAGIKSFDEIVQDRTKALADKIGTALKDKGVPLDEPINLKLDSIGKVTTDSYYKKKIEKLFEDDPDLAKEFKEVAGLNAMKAAQKALEAFDKEKKAAKDDDERDAAYGRYTGRLMRSQELSGTMTLEDGKLRSWSVEFMDASLGETPAAKASTKAEAIAGQRVARTV